MAQAQEELDTFHTVITSVTEAEDLATTMPTILDKAISLAQADAGIIFLTEGRDLVLVAQHGLSPAHLETVRRFPMGQGLTGVVGATGRPVIISDVQTDPFYRKTSKSSAALREGYRTFVVVPLITQKKILGTLNLLHRTPRSFAPSQIQFFLSLGRQVGLSIHTFQQYRELRDTNTQLAELSRRKSHFLANMSHEIRTPLNSIIGFSEVLRDGTYGPLTPKQAHYLDNIHASGEHLLQLINDILDLSKVEAGKIELHRDTFEASPILEALLSFVRPQATNKNLSLSLEVDPALDLISADLARLRQILLNLLGNAIKFTPAGGSVRVSAHRVGGDGKPTTAGEWVEIAVTDTGIGIAPEDQARIFEAFEQAEDYDAKRLQGTGLGLAVTKRLVELHGGTITVTSEPGKGSAFAVRLPLPAVAKDTPPGPLHLLFVDDDHRLTENISEFLRGEGFVVSTALDGPTALRSAREKRPDVILLDILMPGMSGWEVITHLKEDPRTAHIPLLVVTGKDLDSAEEATLRTLQTPPVQKGPTFPQSLLHALAQTRTTPRTNGE